MSTGETYYRFDTVNGCLIITLLPELNDKQWADIERVGTEIVEQISTATSPPKVLVDLTPLSYMGSAMVALIVRLYKTVNSRGGKMAVVNQHELVFEVLKLAGLTKLWTIVPNREEAFAAMGVKPSKAVSISSSSAAGGVQSGGMGIVAAGAIGTLGTLALLALQFRSNSPMTPKNALIVQAVFAFLGLGAGMFLLNQAGNRRYIGVAFMAICVLAFLGAVFMAPLGEPAKAPAAGAAPRSTAVESASATPASTPAPVAATPVASTTPVTNTTPVANTSPAAGSQTSAQPAPAGSFGKRFGKPK